MTVEVNEPIRKTCPDCGATHKRTVSEKCRKCDPPLERQPGGSPQKRARRELRQQLLEKVAEGRAWRTDVVDINDPLAVERVWSESLTNAYWLMQEARKRVEQLDDWRYTDDKGAEQERAELGVLLQSIREVTNNLSNFIGKKIEARRVMLQMEQARWVLEAILHPLEDPRLGLTPAQKALFRQLAAEQLLSHASNDSHALPSETQDSGRGG